MKKATVTIGIPAFNEEKNIVNAIKSVLNQKKDNFIIKKILVYSDGSNDDTVKVSKSIRSRLVQVVKGTNRKGKSFRLNQIFKSSVSDILVLLDADCVLDENAINKLVEKFEKAKVGLVGSNAVPVSSNAFVSSIVSVGVRINKSASQKWRKGKNLYSFRGSLVGLSEKLYKNLSMPSTPGTDAYLYFSALKMGLGVEYAKDAKVYYSLPTILKGHIKQSSRFIQSQRAMKKYFGKNVSKEYELPFKFLLSETVTEIIKNPLYSSLFIILKAFIGFQSLIQKQKITGIWDIASSTKKGIRINEK